MRSKGLRITKYAYLHANNTPVITGLQKYSYKKALAKKIYVYSCLFLMITTFSFYHFGNEEECIDYIKKFIIKIIPINAVQVINNNHVSEKEIMAIANIELPLDIAELNLEIMKKDIETHALIKNVDIRLVLPYSLVIDVVERKPVAVWRHNGIYATVDEEGEILENNFAFNSEMGYVTLVGQNANKKWRLLFDQLKNNPIFEKIYAAQLISNRRWNLLLKDGLIVKLPEDNIAFSLDCMEFILAKYKVPVPLTAIDLRLAPVKVYGNF